MYVELVYFSLFVNQEVERKARKQFKGLFDKKPGEIAHAGTKEEGDQTLAKEQQDEEVDSNSNTSVESDEVVNDPCQESWFSTIWPSGRRLFSALGLQKCTIL